MPVLVIEGKDFLKGVSSFEDVADGGYSPQSKGISPYATPGLLKPGPTVNFSSASYPAEGVFAFGCWSANVAPGITRAVSGTGSPNYDGKFYTTNDSGQPTLANTDTGNDYKRGQTFMVRYKGNFYVTSTTDIAMLNYDLSTADFDYWVTTKGKAALTSTNPHPMAIFADILYIADGRYLHSIDGTTATTQVLILPEDFVITDLELYNGLLYISAAKFQNLTENVPAIDACIFTWDSFSPTFIDQLPLQDPIDSMKVFGGTLLLFCQNYMGYWTGSTVNVLRQLTARVYKNMIGITKDRLYFPQTGDVMCLGNPIMSKPKFFSIPMKMPDFPGGTIDSLYCPRPGYIIFGSTTNMMSANDVDGSNNTSVSFYSNKISLRAYCKVTKIIVESEPLVASSSMTLSFVDSKGVTRTIGVYSNAAFPGVSFHEFQVFEQIPTFYYQQVVTFNAVPKGIRRIYVVHEPVELPPNA